MKLLETQTAIVTGGTSGIGRAIANKFAENGANVVIFGTNEERGAQVVEEIEAKKGKAQFFRVNVADTNEVKEKIDQILGEFGSVDILVNNAGITRDQLLLKMSEEDWDQVMAINLKSCYNTSHALIRSMMKARRGKIINMSSVVGLIGNPGQANYAASKAAIVGLTKALAKELASRNIHVNCIAPGYIKTPMTNKVKGTETILSQIPFGRMGDVEDIANTALFLACAMSDYITGQVITVDGGLAI